MIGQTKDAGAFYYRLTMNTFNGGNYDDNYVDHKLPRMLPVISSFNTKLYPITRQVRKRYFVNVDLEDEDEFRPRYNEVNTPNSYDINLVMIQIYSENHIVISHFLMFTFLNYSF